VLMLKQRSFSKSKSFVLIRILFFLFLSIGVYNSAYSQSMPVPENIQAALLPKVLKFSPNLSQVPKLQMLIVFDSNSKLSKNELMKGIGSTMNVKAIVAEELSSNIDKCDLVYFMPGTQNSAIICKENKVLSVCGISGYVENGVISIAFGVQDNKPKIYVNLSSLESEGQSLSSEILRITKVYK